MITDWEPAIKFVLEMEGGYDDDPKDPGGETNFGICKRDHPALDIKNLTVEDAKAIYAKEYWQECACDQLPTGFAISVFDCAVNQGPGAAKRLLQVALDVPVDGIIGDKTISAAFKADRRKLKLFLTQRLDLYRLNKNIEIYSIDWFFRIISLAELVLQTQTGKIA